MNSNSDTDNHRLNSQLTIAGSVVGMFVMAALAWTLAGVPDATAAPSAKPHRINNVVPVVTGKPGKNGLIVYVFDNRNVSNDYATAPSGIYTVNPVTRKKKRLLKSDKAADPTFSPDGSKLIYTNEVNRSLGLYSMNPDGTDKRKLFDAIDPYNPPVFVPGNKIRFVTVVSEVMTMNLDGSDQRSLGTNHGDLTYGSATADGRKVVYSSCNPSGNNCDVFIENKSTGETKRLTDAPRREDTAEISPNGRLVTFLKSVNDPTDPRYDRAQAWTVRANGANKRKIGHTTGDNGLFDLTFSPDSKTVLMNVGIGRIASLLAINNLERGPLKMIGAGGGSTDLRYADWQSQ